MEVRVKAPDEASADSLRLQLASLFGPTSVALGESRSEVSLWTNAHPLEAVTDALDAIEHWLELDGILAAEVVLDDNVYVVARHTGITPARTPGQHRRFRVLVVDDDPGVRLLCAASLVQAGVEVLEAENGRRGLERALDERPDLVLLDVNMPVLDGFALAERLRNDERTSEVPFVFLTGEPEAESRTRAFALGAAGFVAKPFDPHAVAALVSAVLARVSSSATEPLSA